MKKKNVDLFKVIIFAIIATFVVLSFFGCIQEKYVYFVTQKGLESELGVVENVSNCGWLMLTLGVIECITLRRCSVTSLILGLICSGGGMILTIMMPYIYEALNQMFSIYGGLGYYQYSHTGLGYIAIVLGCIIFVGFGTFLAKTPLSSNSKEEGSNQS